MANPFLSVVTDGRDEKPASTNPFLNVQDDTRQNLGVADVHASEFAPDQYAQASRVSSQIGIPAPVVARNPEEANRIARQKRLDTLAAENPNLAAWLGKTPNAMTFSKDELDHMSFSEKVVQNILAINPFSNEQANARATKRFSIGSAKLGTDAAYTASDRQENFLGIDDATWQKGFKQYATAEKQARDSGHTVLADAINTYAGFFKGYRDVIKQSKQGAAEFGADLGQQQAELSEGLTRTDAPFEYYGGYVADSAPAMLLAMATGGVTASSLTMGATTYNSAYTDSRQAGLDPYAANANATIQGGLEVFFERFGMAKAFGPANTIGKRAAQTIGREAVGEAATTLTQNPVDALFKGEAIDPAKLFADAFDSLVVGAAMGGPEAVAGVRKETAQAKIEADKKKVQDTLKQVMSSTSNAAQLQTLSMVAQDMKLADRSPETAMDYAKMLIESGAPESVFVDGTAFRELFQSDQAAQDAALQFTNDPSAYPLAMSTGGDIVIPLPQYLALAMKSPQAKDIASLARKNQEDLSAAELANYTKDDFIADVTGLDAAQRAEASAQAQAEDKQISDAVIGQLVAANVEQGAAEKYAKLYTSFFRTLGARTGQSATELFNKYMPTIKRLTDGDKLLGVNPKINLFLEQIKSGSMPSIVESYGPSLVEFLADKGGITDTAMTGEIRRLDDSDKARLQKLLSSIGGKRPQKSKQGKAFKPLVNAASTIDLDGAVEIAIEMGYLPEGSDIGDLLEALDRELIIEKPTYAPEFRNEANAQQREAVLQATEILARAGIDPALDPEGAIRALYGEELFQSLDQTETPEFKAWFGDSKVVDADGKPLVVYHGTTENFESFEPNTRKGEQLGFGIHFAESGGFASRYADPSQQGRGKAGGQVVPTYLSITRPLLANAIATEGSSEFALAEKLLGKKLLTVKDENGKRAVWLQNAIDAVAPDRAMREIQAAGYDGVRYDSVIRGRGLNAGNVSGKAQSWIAFRPNQIKSATGNSGAFDPSNPSILYQPADGDIKRGSYKPQENLITLFERADLSTLLHESGHFFLEVLGDMAAAENAPAQIQDDYAAVLRWFGVESREAITVENHEQFARGFEAYLFEGKAPSVDLASAFGRFRAWLVSIYQSLKSLNVTLSPEIRGVFDRLVAADEEIELANLEQSYEPILKSLADAKALGLTERQYEAYVASTVAAADEGKSEVTAKLLNALRREAKGWYKEQLAGIRNDIALEVEQDAGVRAYRVLTGSLVYADGSAIPEQLHGLKLSKESLKGRYTDEFLAKLKGTYSTKAGVHPDIAAEMLGLQSGDALVKALAESSDVDARINALAKQRMNELHPDPMNDGTLADEAMQAAHNSKRVQVLEHELAVLAKAANKPAPKGRILKAIAESEIARKRVRDIRPNEYLIAERKAANLAAKLAAQGKYAEAFMQKRAQALNVALYRAAMASQKMAESQIKYLRKAGTDKTRKRVGKSGKRYVDALDDLLEGHELKAVSGKEVSRRGRLRDWVARVQEMGSNTAVSEELLARVESEKVMNTADLTIEQLTGLHDAVKNLLHLARMKNVLQTKQGKIKWKDAKKLLKDRLEKQDSTNRNGIGSADHSVFEWLQDLYSAGSNWVLQPETIVEWLDGGTSGPWHDILWEPSEDVEHSRERLQTMVGQKLKGAFDAMPKADRKLLDQKFHIASMEKSLSGHTILSALFNMGNDSNRMKLLDGGYVDGDGVRKFTEEQLSEMFSNLTAEQVKLVQGVWDSVQSLWPEIVKLEEEMNGITPDKVAPRAFTVVTKDGPVQLAGGYFPAAYDPRGSKAGALSDDEQAKRVLSGQTPIRASTSKGHVEKRTDFTAPLLLDYHSVLTRHLDGVMSDIAYRRFLPQMYRVLNDPELSRMIHNRLGAGANKALKQGFERGAVGSFALAGPLFGPYQGIADATLTNTASAALGLRVPLALANIVTSPILASARVDKKFLIAGFASYYKNPLASVKMIQRLSPMMLKRAEGRTLEMQSILASMRGKNGPRKTMIEFSMAVHQWIVPLAENAIWLSAYKQAQAGGSDITESVRMADKAIRQTQTKHTAKDISQAEGNPYLRALMLFAGPLVVINNRLQESGLRGLRGDVTSPMQALGVWMAMAAGGTWIFELLMGRGPEDEDDDEDVDIKDWIQWCARKLALMPFSAYPILRESAAYMDSGFSRPSPLVDAGNKLYNFGKAVVDAGDKLLFTDEEINTDKLTKEAIGAAGTVTGVPSNQLLRTGSYLIEVGNGQHTPVNPVKEAGYLMQGPPKE